MTATCLAHLFSREDFQEAIDRGYVSVQTHPSLPLVIYNYTPSAQYERAWNPVTTACRGLIADLDGNIVARPFAKFFNFGEIVDQHTTLPAGDPIVTEKMDGSLGIIYTYTDPWTGYPHIAVATRGSFTSDQAVWATQWLHTNMPDFSQPEGVTTLVEIIYPQNRIVVDYGEKRDLVLLGAILNSTGQDIDFNKIDWWDGERAALRGYYDSIEATADVVRQEGWAADVFETEWDGGEGVVLTWPQDKAPSFRLKIKHPRYVELHRIVTGLSTRTVHEALANGTFGDLIANVPDEFHPWVRQVAEDLDAQYDKILWQARSDLQECRLVAEDLADHVARDFDFTYSRKDLAAAITKRATYPGLCFALEDGKNVNDKIWQMIRPERETAMILDDNQGEP